LKALKNSIDLVLDTQVDILVPGEWKGIEPDEDIKEMGILGQDDMGIVVGKNFGEKTFLRLWYRDLFDAGAKKYYRVNLVKERPWLLESDQQRIIFTNSGEEKVGKYIVTTVTVSVK